MPQLVIIVGSESDKTKLVEAGIDQMCKDIGVSYSANIISAHRSPQILHEFCINAAVEAQVFIGAAGLFPALPGAISGVLQGSRPVLGVVLSAPSGSVPATFSVGPASCMPPGIPVAIMGVDIEGLKNAVQFAASIIAQKDEGVSGRLAAYIQAQQDKRAPQFEIDITKSTKKE